MSGCFQVARSPFYELGSTLPIRQQFANLCILEYPVIHVCLPSQSYDFEVIKDASSIIRKPEFRSSASNDHLSPEGVPFKEEEIEDTDFLDPKVFDFMKQGTSDRATSAIEAGGNGLQSSSKTKEQGLSEDMEFDFDQGLIDVYLDLIAQINPDDFLDLEGEFTNEEEVVGRENSSYLMGVLPEDDDIEEGEILE